MTRESPANDNLQHTNVLKKGKNNFYKTKLEKEFINIFL